MGKRVTPISAELAAEPAAPAPAAAARAAASAPAPAERAPAAPAPAAAERPRVLQLRTPMHTEYLLVALLVALIEMAVGFYSWYINPTDLTPYPSDGFSRVANAYYVVFCDPPTLANIGGVWNPLPSMVEIPLVWLSQFWKPLASYALAGVVASSLFTGGTAGLLAHAFRKFAGLSRPVAYVLVGLFVFNPFFFYYGFNGMSETFSYFFVVLTMYLLMQWMSTGKPFFVSAVGFALMGLFLVRYEAIPFAIGVWLAMFVFIWRSPREQRYVLGGRWEKLHYVEATSIIMVLPLVFVIIVWVLYNWIILGDPLYFLHSAYSNSVQAQYAAQYASFGDAVADLTPKIVPFIIVYVFILGARALTGRFLRKETLVITLLVLSMMGFHLLLLAAGGSYGWLRFYSYAMPICTVWLAYEIHLAAKQRRLWVTVSALALAVSLPVCGAALFRYDYSGHMSIAYLQKIATYVEENVEPDTLLVDSFTTWGVLLQMDSLDKVVTSCSPAFDASVEDPVRMEIGYVLVPDDTGANTSDALLTKWPELAQGKEIPGFTLVEEFSGTQNFYLYKVDPSAKFDQAQQ